MAHISRYRILSNGKSDKFIPFIKLDLLNSDIIVAHKRGRIKFDELSQKYYGDPNYGWIIATANSISGLNEWYINTDKNIIIPYPLQTHLNIITSKVINYNKLYGNS